MHITRILSALLLGAVACYSCTKEGPAGATGATGPAGPSYTGAISGHVSLYDQYGSKVLTGLSSVQLTLKGGATVNPDASGYYIFGGAKTGSYNISASKDNYGSTSTVNFQYLSDTLNRDIKMSMIPGFSPTSFTAYQGVVVPGDSLVINFDPDTRARNCIVFLNSNSTVNGQPANYLLYYTKNIAANQQRVTIVIPQQDLYDAGFTSGNTVYYAAYGYVLNDASVYEDLTTGKGVFNAISAASLTSSAVTP